MNTGIRALMSLALVVLPSLASAAPVTLTVRGNVTSIGALQNNNSVAAPAGRIVVGDAYTLTATFDPKLAVVGSLYDADPTINIYSLPGAIINFTTTGYARSFSPLYDFNATTQLWNNYLSAGQPVDSQSFSFFDYNVKPRSLLPFDLGAGLQSLSLNFYAFDSSATARSNDLISQLALFSAFSSKSFSLGQLNADTNFFVSVQASVTGATITSVPEPASWAMLIIGFGLVGAMMRRREAQVGMTAA